MVWDMQEKTGNVKPNIETSFNETQQPGEDEYFSIYVNIP